MSKEYLGDSVYAEADPSIGTIILTTENGESSPSNSIYLEYSVIQALKQYIIKEFPNA